MDNEIKETYREDTAGRRYMPHFTSATPPRVKDDRPESVTTFRIKEPITSKEFIRLPNDLKQQYIDYLIGDLKASKKEISEMLGYSQPTCFSEALKRYGIRTQRRAKKRTAKEEKAWRAFLKMGKAEIRENIASPSAPIQAAMLCASCSFTLTGTLNSAEIADMIAKLMPDGKMVRVSVSIEEE